MSRLFVENHINTKCNIEARSIMNYLKGKTWTSFQTVNEYADELIMHHLIDDICEYIFKLASKDRDLLIPSVVINYFMYNKWTD